MAQIDVSELLNDPDFCSQITLIRRASSVNTYGEGALTETSSTITAVVQSPKSSILEILPAGVRISDYIAVYFGGEFITSKSGNYADVVIHRGKRYQAMEVIEDHMDDDTGFTVTLFQLEDNIG